MPNKSNAANSLPRFGGTGIKLLEVFTLKKNICTLNYVPAIGGVGEAKNIFILK